MQLDAIFKAYDIRGLVPSQLDEATAERIGAAFAVFSGAGRLAVGRDCRLSSPCPGGGADRRHLRARARRWRTWG